MDIEQPSKEWLPTWVIPDDISTDLTVEPAQGEQPLL
jgi:hypothetical protein